MISALTYRFSNYSAPLTSSELDAGFKQAEMNTGAIHAGPLMYGLGRMDKSRMIEFLFPRYEPVVDIINEDGTLGLDKEVNILGSIDESDEGYCDGEVVGTV